MRLRLTLLLAFIGLALIPKQSKAQLYKQWGFWLTDTTFLEQDFYNFKVLSVTTDTKSNVYIQYTNPIIGRDSVMLSKIHKNGEKLWTKYYTYNDTNILFSTSSNRIFWWNDKLILITPYWERNTTDWIFKFQEINRSNGETKNTWNIIAPKGKAIDDNAGFINNGDGTLFFTGHHYNASIHDVVKFDLNDSSTISNTYYASTGLFTINKSAVISNIDDSLITLVSSIGEIGNFQNTFGIQCNFIKKSDLSVHNFHFTPILTTPRAIYSQNSNAFLFGVEFFKIGIHGQLNQYKTALKTNSVTRDKAYNFYLNDYDQDNLYVRKLNENMETLWEYSEPNNNLDTIYKTGIVQFKRNLFLHSSINYRFHANDGSKYYFNQGLKTSALNINGIKKSEHRENLNYTYGQIIRTNSILDYNGNPINWITYQFRDSTTQNINKATGFALYFYKLCANCDTTTPPPLPPAPPFEFTNYLKVLQNPTSKNLNYNFGLVTPGRVRIIINDVSGKVVYKKTNEYKKGAYTETINLSHLGLQPGSYFLNMITDYKKYSKQFILNN